MYSFNIIIEESKGRGFGLFDVFSSPEQMTKEIPQRIKYYLPDAPEINLRSLNPLLNSEIKRNLGKLTQKLKIKTSLRLQLI